MSITAPNAFMYVDCDVPPEMTLDEWRRRNPTPTPTRVRLRRAVRRISYAVA